MSDMDKDRINYDNDRDFGLRDVAYNPIDRDASDQPDAENNFNEEDEEEEKGTNWGLIIGIIATVLLVVWALIYIFVFDGAESLGLVEDEPPVVEQPVTEPEPEPEPVIDNPEPEPEPVVEDPAPEPEPAGTNAYSEVVLLDAPTGKTYVVVGSFIDDDLAMDLAGKMESQGGGARIIPPFGSQSLAYRVAVADFDTFQEASNNIEKFRSTFGPETWILKY